MPHPLQAIHDQLTDFGFSPFYEGEAVKFYCHSSIVREYTERIRQIILDKYKILYSVEKGLIIVF